MTKFGLRLVHHKHTGRRVHAHHTAYTALFFILSLAGATLFLVGLSVDAGPPIISNDGINLTTIVPGPPPSTSAVVRVPRGNNVYVYKSELTIKGSCEIHKFDRAVEVYRLSAFAGSAACAGSGEFEITITLLPGKNDIVVRTVDWVGQYGPDSDTLIVNYIVPTDGSGPGNLANNIPPLLIFTKEHILKGINRNKDHSFAYEIKGGKPPYAVTIDWDDDTHNDVASLSQSGKYNFSHKYSTAGLHLLTVSAVDMYSNKAIYQVLAVVNESSTSPPSFVGNTTLNDGTDICYASPNDVECYVTSRVVDIVNKLWPAFIMACLMTISFWFGERIVYMRYFHHRQGTIKTA